MCREPAALAFWKRMNECVCSSLGGLLKDLINSRSRRFILVIFISYKYKSYIYYFAFWILKLFRYLTISSAFLLSTEYKSVVHFITLIKKYNRLD